MRRSWPIAESRLLLSISEAQSSLQSKTGSGGATCAGPWSRSSTVDVFDELQPPPVVDRARVPFTKTHPAQTGGGDVVHAHPEVGITTVVDPVGVAGHLEAPVQVPVLLQVRSQLGGEIAISICPARSKRNRACEQHVRVLSSGLHVGRASGSPFAAEPWRSADRYTVHACANPVFGASDRSTGRRPHRIVFRCLAGDDGSQPDDDRGSHVLNHDDSHFDFHHVDGSRDDHHNEVDHDDRRRHPNHQPPKPSPRRWMTPSTRHLLPASPATPLRRCRPAPRSSRWIR